jgi:hypothetical protein
MKNLVTKYSTIYLVLALLLVGSAAGLFWYMQANLRDAYMGLTVQHPSAPSSAASHQVPSVLRQPQTAPAQVLVQVKEFIHPLPYHGPRFLCPEEGPLFFPVVLSAVNKDKVIKYSTGSGCWGNCIVVKVPPGRYNITLMGLGASATYQPMSCTVPDLPRAELDIYIRNAAVSPCVHYLHF